MIINGKNTNKFKESSALGVEHYQNLISQPAKTTTKNTVSYEPVNISNFVKQIENEVSNKQTTTERIQSKMDKLWVDNTPNTSTVETSNTPQLRTTLAQQIKNGTAPSIQGKAKNNTLKQTANNVVKSVSEKVPVVNKYAQAYQTAKDNVAKVNAEIKASGLDFTDKEKQLLRSGNYSINYNYDPNEPNSLTNQKLKQNVILTPQDIYNNSNALGKAKIIARNVSDNVKKSVNTAFDLVGKGAAGVTQGLEGLADFGVASVGNSLSDLTSVRGLFPNKVSEGIRNKTENFVKKNLGMSEFVDEISEEKGGIYNPKILGVPVRNAVQEVARMFTTGVLGGLPTMMASAAGSSTEEALNEGENLSNAYKYGAISGAIEGATEKMFDAANLFGGGAVSKLSGKISRTFAGKVLEATAGEGVEEMVSQALNPFVKMITYKGETENPFGSWENFKNYLKDIGTAGYEGAIIGGFTLGMSAPGNVELQKSFSNDVYKAVDKLQGIDQVRKNEIANAIIEGTKSVTGEDIKNIRSFVENYKKTSGIQQQNAPSTISKENVTGLPKSSLYNSPTTQLQKPSNETISNQVKTAQNVNTGVTEQNSLKTVKTEPKTEEMSSKNELNKKLFDERMELFDELVKKGYAEYKIVNKSTEMFRTDKWNNEADQIYKKIEKLFNEEYYPSTVTDSAKQSQAIASLPTQEEQVNDLPTQKSVENVREMKYNQVESEAGNYGINTTTEKGNLGRDIGESNIFENSKHEKEYQYREWEKSIVPKADNELTSEEQILKQYVKDNYHKNIVYIKSDNSKGYNAGASLDNADTIYISYEKSKEFGVKRTALHEVMESSIRYANSQNRDIIISSINNLTSNSKVFEKQKKEFLIGQKSDTSDNAIAKDIICDRFAQLNGQELDYIIYPETANIIDMSIEYFNKQNEDSNKSSFSLPATDNQGRTKNNLKQKQLDIIQKYNPMRDDYHTGIRTIEDIKEFKDTIDDDESFIYGDFSREDAIKALEKGEVTVYSSYPIENGGFVSTSRNQARDYAGNGKIYSKIVPLKDVAWINGDEGQYAKVNDLPTKKSVENVQQGNKISQFKSSENGRPYMNLNKEISTNNESKNNRTGLSEIESVINEIVPVRHGKFRQKAYGIYKNRGEIIRIKQKNDIPVALHELTHHLDKQLGLSKTGKFDSELIPIAVVSDSANIDTKRAEGVAEFGRYYMTDPEYAKSIAPTYFEAFEENLKQSPQMYAKVEQLQNMVSDYLRQSPLNRTLSHIDFGDEETNLFKRVKDKYSEFKKTFRKNFVDDLDPLKQVINDITDNKKLPVDKDAYARLRLNRGVTGKVQVALEYGIVNNQGQKVGKSLKEIIEPVSKNMDEFVAYISALRAKDLQARNERVETGFNARDIDEIIKLYGENKEFNKASEELYKFQNQIMQKTLVSSGIITPEALEAYNKSNPHYVPFYRVMDENFNQTKDSMSKKPKKIKGSTRDIINPLESIVKNVYSYYMIADKNNAYKFLFSLANEYDGTGKWFDKVPTDMSGEKITAQDVKGILDKLDVNKEDIDYNELFTTLFKPSNYQKGNIITVMDKGKPVHYEIMDKDLYKILAPSSSKNENIFAKILSGGSSALRVGATHTLEFTLRNPIKDTFDAFTYSKNKFRPVVDTVIGIFNVAGKSDLYYKWLESGGSGSSYTNAQRATLKNTLEGITPNFENKSIPQKIGKSVKSAVTHPLKTYLNLIGELSNVTEEGTRVGEFRRALQNNKTLKQAALESRDITVDFSRGGEHIKEANKYIAFLNANVQGLDKMFTAFKERPVATTIKGLLAFVIPSMLIAALSGDDRDKVPQWEKDSHWIFFIGNTPVRIPKPQGIGGAFSNLGESIVDYMRTKNPEVFNHFVLEVLQSYNPTSDIASVLPNTFQPIVENTANYSFFKEQPIVKQSLENRSPKYQYDEYTSTIAKKIGSTLNVSPKKVDNLISGYFGNLGKDVANLLGVPFDVAEGKNKDYESTNSKLKKIPLVKGFIASDYANPKLDKFYENKSQALTDYTDVKFKYADKLDADTITDKVIDSSKLNAKEKKELKQAKNINSLYNSAYNKIKDKNDEIDKIEQGKGSNQFKKVQIDKVNKEINKILEQVEKDVETYKKRGTLPTKDD